MNDVEVGERAVEDRQPGPTQHVPPVVEHGPGQGEDRRGPGEPVGGSGGVNRHLRVTGDEAGVVIIREQGGQ